MLHVLTQRSVAQTWTPNSRRRNIEDMARPQPRSSTRIPGLIANPVVNHSVSQRVFAPLLAPAITHSGWYLFDRKNRLLISRLSNLRVTSFPYIFT